MKKVFIKKTSRPSGTSALKKLSLEYTVFSRGIPLNCILGLI